MLVSFEILKVGLVEVGEGVFELNTPKEKRPSYPELMTKQAYSLVLSKTIERPIMLKVFVKGAHR